VVYSKQKRPAQGISALIDGAESDEEKYLYLLLAAAGMRVSEALALVVWAMVSCCPRKLFQMFQENRVAGAIKRFGQLVYYAIE